MSRITLSILLAALASVPAALAQNTRNSPQGDTWDSIKLLPEWSGGWADYDVETGRFRGGQVSNQIPFRPATQAKVDEFRRLAAAGGDVTARTQNCYPSTFTGSMGGPEAYLEFLFTPGRVTITNESGMIRRIYTDGRKIPDEPGETFHGM